MDFDYPTLSFLCSAAVATVAALAAISARNTVHAVLWLVLTFVSVACTWIVGNAEFLGLMLVLVYVGAVMVLFLFVVMMLDMDRVPLREGFVRYLPVGLVVAAVMLAQMLVLVGVRSAVEIPLPADPAAAAGTSNAQWLAHTLFTNFLLPFEVAAVILTVAVVAAVMLTLRRREGTRHQNPSEQVRARPSDRLRMVKMQAVRKVAQEPASSEEAKP
ncbi:MAG: NADH-quinone oxidoreductase subunit J [Thermomonas sp.]|uniref:NADH-quinone oxidoreductase subunit J n=1 Tax=Thermomonas sp. TaxID=1971895 RepID=UPI002611EF4A|nr:NADH-quinone oxidoreductase subunit J [Thermomonas sp.]MCC7096640.1 NADH-quinone oxidoreductase subunit J [Thermomonas sp.]